MSANEFYNRGGKVATMVATMVVMMEATTEVRIIKVITKTAVAKEDCSTTMEMVSTITTL